jgi:hypothetical protein
MKYQNVLSVLVLLLSVAKAAADAQAPVAAPAVAPVPKVVATLATPPPLNAMIKCDELATVSTGSDSPNYQYFKDLLARGSDAPLADFLKLWYPDRGDGTNLDSPFFACESEALGAFTQPGDNQVPATCRPDVLYSWGTVQKSHLTRHHPDGTEWTGPVTTYNMAIANGTVFASISAVSTFGYGDTLMRFKIKPGTPFNFQQFGASAGEVSVRTYIYHDFAISDSAVLESISVGTPEIYDEIIRDILRYQSGKRVSVYVSNQEAGIERLYAQAEDGNDQSELHLKRNLIEIIREITSGEGQVVYAKGSCRNRSRKFSTAYPNYIEPSALTPAN